MNESPETGKHTPKFKARLDSLSVFPISVGSTLSLSSLKGAAALYRMLYKLYVLVI